MSSWATSLSMDIFLKFLLLGRALSKNPLKVWGVFAASRIAAFRQPWGIHMDCGGERQNNARGNFRLEGAIAFKFRVRWRARGRWKVPVVRRVGYIFGFWRMFGFL